jgi:subtilisin family serine protease
MLRRFTASFNAIALAIVSLIPLTASSAKPNARQARQPLKVSKLAPELRSANGAPATSSGALVRVVIQTKGRPSRAQQSAVANAKGALKQSYEALDTFVAEVPLNSLESLAAREDVAYISTDRTVRSQMSLTRDTVGATEVAAGLSHMPGFTGKGVTVAVMDSGISTTHPDFTRGGNKSRILTAVDFTGNSAPATRTVMAPA